MSKQLENRISSREVAEMMEMQHKDLLKKIDNINKDIVDGILKEGQANE